MTDLTDEEYAASCIYCCSCGEAYPTVSAAIHCRKCRRYSPRGFCTEVTGPGYQVFWKCPDVVGEDHVDEIP